MAYLLLKWLHVLAAIIVVGAHAAYGVWIVRASRDPEALPFTLRTVKWIDDHVGLPAFVALPVLGVAMAFMVPTLWRLPWLITGLVLFVILQLAHLFIYRPALRRMIRLLESHGIDSPEYQSAAHTEARFGIAMTVLMVIIVFVMVVKPVLWG